MVDIRRQQRNAAVTALGNITGNLFRIIQHTGHQRSHVLFTVMAFKICRLISNHRIADGVSLIEGVVCKVVDFLINGLRHGSGNAACHAAGDLPFRITVDKGILLLLDLGGLFLGDGAAHHIGLSQRVAR